MKKVLFLIMMVLVLAGCVDTSPRAVAAEAQEQAAVAAMEAVPIPSVSYFQEKRTIAKWAERWDKPAVAAYVYLVSYGNILGYYVSDGKPASTRSYLMPEETYQKMTALNGGSLSTTYAMISAPDIDGTYGENNPGIRFFTAEGIAVEWGGSGACYIFTDAPLPLNVPRLNVSRN